MRLLGHALVWPSLLLMLCGWIISLVGLIFLQYDCKRGLIRSLVGAGDGGFGIMTAAALTGIPFGIPGGCRHTFRWMWFVWILELLIAVGLPLSLIGGLLFKGVHSGWIGVNATMAALNMLVANMLYNLVRLLPDGRYERRAQTALAGFAISAAANILLMLGLGGGDAAHRRQDRYDDYQHQKAPDMLGRHDVGGRPPAGVTPTTAGTMA